ncbi:DUF2332 domain-containing protein [Ureibacillus sp. GCM10028918]|uniref:DUF2332 domain-containing protein n=1 Tax=Ureibacillus sp. GCM10028918 TaxID=3273429 RepID=UPI00361D0F33
MDIYTKIFQQFAEKEAKGSSQLYYFLSKRVVEDLDLMEIIREIPASQPKPNLFFASMQYLLSKTENPLREYYPSFTKNPLPIEDSFELFKEFALKHKNHLIKLFHSKLVQTNEVRRAAYLYPLFLRISEKTNKPLTLIEIGTSAGLLLCLDAYNYEYAEENKSLKIENLQDSILIQSENRGNQLPSYIHSKLKINNRFGIDLNIVDLNNQEEYEWMLALIWPEHSDRRKQFNEASQIANNIKKDMFEGDLLKRLPHIIKSSKPENQIVLFHTHVANQFPAQLKKDFLELLDELSYTRSIYHVYNNMFDANLHQDFIKDGKVIEELILKSPDGHGKWFYWS